MKYVAKIPAQTEFSVVCETQSAQAAIMTLQPGDSSDSALSNEHPRCEQWLYVIAGAGRATAQKPGAARRSVRLKEGNLLVIERRERHQIRNTGKTPLVTLNMYVPPAYDKHGEVRPSARK